MRSRGSIPLLLNRHIASPLATPNMDRKIWINVVPSARLVDTPSKKRNHSSALDILLNFPIPLVGGVKLNSTLWRPSSSPLDAVVDNLASRSQCTHHSHDSGT